MVLDMEWTLCFGVLWINDNGLDRECVSGWFSE